MSADDACSAFAVAGRALEAALTRPGCADAEAEVLLKRSRGRGLRLARGTAGESSTWIEQTVAVRVTLPDGRTALAAASSWREAASAGRRAADVAMLLAPREGDEDLPAWRRAAPVRQLAALGTNGGSPLSTDEELLQRLAEVEAEALAVDERVTALDTGLARDARVETYLASSRGIACHQAHDAAQLHAAVVARDGLRFVSHAEGWAGSRLGPEEARALGRRLGRAALLQLTGVSGAPSRGTLVLSPSAACEFTFAVAPLLLAMGEGSPLGPVGRDGGAAAGPLRLVEDAVLDLGARRLAVDGAARPLREIDVVRAGRWLPPSPESLPLVRPGAADAPVPGWLRLSWLWEGELSSPEALVSGVGAGLHVESASTLAIDEAALEWHGLVAGHWVEDGRRRHAVARLPLILRLPDALERVAAAGDDLSSAHASGTVRAPTLLLPDVPLR